MQALTNFERYILMQEVPTLGLPQLPGNASDVDLFERAWILGYGPGSHISRGDENLRRLAITVGVLPGSKSEIEELEKVGF